MAFLDFCMMVLVFYIITQLLLPWLFPGTLEYNWLFKSKKPKPSITEKVTTLTQQKNELKKVQEEVLDETKTNLKEAKKTHEEAKKTLKN